MDPLLAIIFGCGFLFSIPFAIVASFLNYIGDAQIGAISAPGYGRHRRSVLRSRWDTPRGVRRRHRLADRRDHRDWSDVSARRVELDGPLQSRSCCECCSYLVGAGLFPIVAVGLLLPSVIGHQRNFLPGDAGCASGSRCTCNDFLLRSFDNGPSVDLADRSAIHRESCKRVATRYAARRAWTW